MIDVSGNYVEARLRGHLLIIFMEQVPTALFPCSCNIITGNEGLFSQILEFYMSISLNDRAITLIRVLMNLITFYATGLRYCCHRLKKGLS